MNGLLCLWIVYTWYFTNMGTQICKKKLTQKLVLKGKNWDLQAVHLFSPPGDNQNILKKQGEKRDEQPEKPVFIPHIFRKPCVYYPNGRINIGWCFTNMGLLSV